MNILPFKENLSLLNEAFKKWSAPVISTMGGSGRNVIIQTPQGMRITQDGVTVVRNLQPTEPIDQIAVSLLVDAATKVVQEVGDGTTLTVLLTTRLFEALSGLNLPLAEMNKQVDRAVAQVVENLRLQAIHGDSQLKLRQIAKIACHGNEDLGHTVADLAFKVGKDGMIFIQQSPSSETYTEYQDGYVLDSGLLSSHFVNQKDGSCKLQDPLFVLIDENVDNENEVIQIMTYLKANYLDQGKKRPLAWVVSNMEGGALATVIANLPGQNPRGLNLPMCVIKAPGQGRQRTEFFEDLRQVTGTPFVYSRIFGRSLRDFGKDFDIDEFGSGASVVSNFRRSVVFTANKPIEHIKGLKEAWETENDPQVRDFLIERIAKLSAGVGTIYTGGDSDSEHQWVFDMADDAQRACMAAMKGGIVPGAGKALLTAAHQVGLEAIHSGQMNPTFLAVLGVLSEPMRTIYENAQVPFDQDAETSDPFVVDVAFGGRVNPVDAGIIDPVLVPVAALTKAASVVKQAMKTSFLLTK